MCIGYWLAALCSCIFFYYCYWGFMVPKSSFDQLATASSCNFPQIKRMKCVCVERGVPGMFLFFFLRKTVHSIQHFTSTLVVMLHLHPLCSSDCPGMEPRWHGQRGDTLQHKHGTHIDFMRRHYWSGKCWWNAVYVTLKMKISAGSLTTEPWKPLVYLICILGQNKKKKQVCFP